MKRLLNKLNKAQDKYISDIDFVYQSIKHKVDFDFFIMYQYSDGFVIVDYQDSHNAPIDKCFDIIKEKGVLSYEDYLIECI